MKKIKAWAVVNEDMDIFIAAYETKEEANEDLMESNFSEAEKVVPVLISFPQRSPKKKISNK